MQWGLMFFPPNILDSEFLFVSLLVQHSIYHDVCANLDYYLFCVSS